MKAFLKWVYRKMIEVSESRAQAHMLLYKHRYENLLRDTSKQ